MRIVSLKWMVPLLLLGNTLVGVYAPVEWSIGWGLFTVVCYVWFAQPEEDSVQQPIDPRTEVLEQIIGHLPPALSIGAKTPEDVLQRVLHMWEDFETMRVILDRILEGVVLVSSEGEVLLANTRALQLLRLQSGMQVTDVKIHKKGQRLFQETLEGTEGEITWYEGRKPNRQYFEMMGLPVEQGGALFVIRDITTLRQLERVRRDFIANISHELRTPITTILMNVEALLDDHPQDRFVQSIHRNADRLSVLVNGLLDLSRIEAGEMEINVQMIHLRPIIDRVISTLKERLRHKMQSIEVYVDASMCAAVDAQAIEQVLSNLITNAIKYSPENSVIVVRGANQSDYVEIEVEDNGQGVPLKHQNRLFERFYRVDKGRSRDEGGTGLGLAIVRHLVEAMGGEVGIRDAKPQGAIFWVRLPISISETSG